MKNQKIGVLWDMDGVLVDSAEPHYISWRNTMKEIGEDYTRTDFKRTFGMNNRNVLATKLGYQPDAALCDRLGDQKEAAFRELVSKNTRSFPGISDLVKELYYSGVSQAVASSAPTENIDVLVDNLGLRKYFQALVSGSVLPSKPDPAVFLKAAGILNLQPGVCVVIEDAVHGVEAGKKAGMKCIALTTTSPPADFDSADLVIENPADLTKDLVFSLIE